MNGSDAADQPIECAVKTRYRQSDLACTVHASGAQQLAADRTWRVTLREAARAVTPGQYAVFYRGALCLGGGVIARAFNSRLGAPARGIAYNSLFSVEGS